MNLLCKQSFELSVFYNEEDVIFNINLTFNFQLVFWTNVQAGGNRFADGRKRRGCVSGS